MKHMTGPGANPTSDSLNAASIDAQRVARVSADTHIPAEEVVRIEKRVRDGKLSAASANAMFWVFRTFPKSLKKLAE